MPAQPKSTQLLANKKFLILGGSSGIGNSIASALIEENASVVISSSSEERVQAAVKKLADPELQFNADPKRISGHSCNLKGPEVEKSLEDLFSKVGKIDGLVYTAADSLALKPIEEQDYNSIVEAGQVRFFSAILAAKVGSKYINEGGSIILTTGSVSVKPIPSWSVVNGFATGLIGLARGLALDLSKNLIRVNAVSPGVTETELWAGMPKDQRDGFMDQIAKTTLVKHVSSADEVARSYIYLLKDTNITGETIFTDGGSRYFSG